MTASDSRESVDLPPPPEGTLRHGDLLWPKKKGAIIPYLHNEVGVDADYLREKEDWEAGQEAFRLAGKPEDLSDDEFAYLSSLTYEAFRQAYGEEAAAGNKESLRGAVSVGHVAIVDVVDGQAFVIEALMKPGVVRSTYADWAAKRADEQVWHGRLRSPVAEAPDRFVALVRQQVGKPYRFWNFNLVDTHGFYCSKLVWYAAYTAFGIALDGNMSPRRGFWYSPKQLSRSSYVGMIQHSGSYG